MHTHAHRTRQKKALQVSLHWSFIPLQSLLQMLKVLFLSLFHMLKLSFKHIHTQPHSRTIAYAHAPCCLLRIRPLVCRQNHRPTSFGNQNGQPCGELVAKVQCSRHASNHHDDEDNRCWRVPSCRAAGRVSDLAVSDV